MKLTITYSSLQCQCGWAIIAKMSHYCLCANPECENYGKRFELPFIEVTEIQQAAVAAKETDNG